MRNKAEFIKDVKEVLKPDVLTDEQIVEDAAHTMNHTGETVYTVPAVFTKTEMDESFLFEKKDRPATDGTIRMVNDYFYIGKGRDDGISS